MPGPGVGTTTAALLSRAKVYMLSPLSTDEILTLLERALNDEKRGLANERIEISQDRLRQIAVFSNGDARAAYNTLETAAAAAPRTISNPDVQHVRSQGPGGNG